MAAKPCLVCGTPSDDSRCPAHRKQQKRREGPSPYNRLHYKIKKQTVERWVRIHGWVCPGYQIPAHPVQPGGLDGEHIIPRSIRPDLAYEPSNYGVLCQACNTRKGNRLN